MGEATKFAGLMNNYQEEDGSNDFPADLPVNTGSESRHVSDVATDAIDTWSVQKKKKDEKKDKKEREK